MYDYKYIGKIAIIAFTIDVWNNNYSEDEVIKKYLKDIRIMDIVLMYAVIENIKKNKKEED